jgi:C4-dicarboxylate-specific signal transduction histidine kinase
MLRQILVSILANAIDVLPQGGDHGAVQQTGARCELRITDTGHGIQDDVRKRCSAPSSAPRAGAGHRPGAGQAHGRRSGAARSR